MEIKEINFYINLYLKDRLQMEFTDYFSRESTDIIASLEVRHSC